MNVIGIRCSNTDFAFAILSGTQKQPQLIESGHVLYPKGFSKPHSLKWLYHEIESLIKTHSIKKIGIKASETKSANKTFEDRVEHEAMVYLVAANCNIREIAKKRKNTLAKQLGFKGQAHYLTQIDTSIIRGFDKSDDKVKEAILVAWSDLQ
jgi:Holliday junction resolvasome RuvABC endonuclease subunit